MEAQYSSVEALAPSCISARPGQFYFMKFCTFPVASLPFLSFWLILYRPLVSGCLDTDLELSNSRPRGFLKSSRVHEALEKTIKARIEDRNPIPDQRATLGLASMAYINLSWGSAALLPQFSAPRNEELLLHLLSELLISSVQMRALFGINWRLKVIMIHTLSVSTLDGGSSCFCQILLFF